MCEDGPAAAPIRAIRCDPDPATRHGSGLHTHKGIQAAADRLEEAIKGIDDWATAREKLIEELNTIGDEIQHGTFP